MGGLTHVQKMAWLQYNIKYHLLYSLLYQQSEPRSCQVKKSDHNWSCCVKILEYMSALEHMYIFFFIEFSFIIVRIYSCASSINEKNVLPCTHIFSDLGMYGHKKLS